MASSIKKQCVNTVSRIVDTAGVIRKRCRPSSRVSIATNIGLKCSSAGCSIELAGLVVNERKCAASHVFDAGAVVEERLKTGGGVVVASSIKKEGFRTYRSVVVAGGKKQGLKTDGGVVVATHIIGEGISTDGSITSAAAKAQKSISPLGGITPGVAAVRWGRNCSRSG